MSSMVTMNFNFHVGNGGEHMWVDLSPNEEPMEVDLPKDEEEPMEVDPHEDREEPMEIDPPAKLSQ